MIYLDNHFLSGDSSVGESELVALAARSWLAESGIAVRQSIADDHWLVVIARNRRTTVADARRVLVNDIVAIR